MRAALEPNPGERNARRAGRNTHARRLDRRQRVAAQLRVDVPAAQVVHHYDVVALVAQVQRRRPAAEPVPAQDEDLLLAGAVGDAVGGDGAEERARRPSRGRGLDRWSRARRGEAGRTGRAGGDHDEGGEKREIVHGELRPANESQNART